MKNRPGIGSACFLSLAFILNLLLKVRTPCGDRVILGPGGRLPLKKAGVLIALFLHIGKNSDFIGVCGVTVIELCKPNEFTFGGIIHLILSDMILNEAVRFCKNQI